MKTTNRKVLLFVVAFVLGAGCSGAVLAEQASQIVPPSLKEYRIVRSVTEAAQRCIDCHAVESRKQGDCRGLGGQPARPRKYILPGLSCRRTGGS